MKRTMEMRRLAFVIEWHWVFIMRGRRKGEKLLNAGLSLSSPKLLKLNRRLSVHCTKAMKAQKRYEDLVGITNLLHGKKPAIT